MSRLPLHQCDFSAVVLVKGKPVKYEAFYSARAVDAYAAIDAIKARIAGYSAMLYPVFKFHPLTKPTMPASVQAVAAQLEDEQ